MIRGSCLCEVVQFQLSDTPEEMVHCHCSMCRKFHGAAFATFVRTARAALRFTDGEDRIRRYRSSPRVQRCFCAQCGSALLFLFDGMLEAAWVVAGVFDDDPAVRASAHIFVASKAPWHEITDDLPRHAGYP